MNVRRVLGALAATLVLAACSGPDQTAVPDVADAPFLCDGVPREGVELLLGGTAAVDETSGQWGDDGVGFYCALSHGDGVVLVDEEASLSSPWGPTDADVVASMKRGGGQPIDADAPGAGYAWGDANAGWVCDGRTVSVKVRRVDVDGRDVLQDTTRLLTSMLPWGCEGETVPSATPDE